MGHRVVHGGQRFSASVVVDDATTQAIADLADLAPLHNPANVAGIRAVSAVLPDVPQVAVFDTAFHQTMPPRAYRYAVPEAVVRRLRASAATGSTAPATVTSAPGPPSCWAGRSTSCDW